MISRNRKAKYYLIHRGISIYGPFARVVAASDNLTGQDAANAMKAYGCNPHGRPGHSMEIRVPHGAAFASWYAKYTLPSKRLSELKDLTS